MTRPMPVEPAADLGPTPDDHLWDYVHVVLRRRWLVLVVFLAVVSVATFRSVLTRPVYQGTARLLIDRNAPAVLNFRDVAEVNAAWWGDEYFKTQYEILQSRVLARRVVEELKLLQDPEWGGPRPAAEVEAAVAARPGESPVMEGAIDRLVGRLRVSPVKNSRVVNVSVEAFRPDLAARLANAVSELYMTHTVEVASRTNRESGQWLGDQIEAQRQKVEAAERALRAMKEQRGTNNADERRALLQQRLVQLGSSLTTLRTERIQAEAAYLEMKRAERPEDLPEVTSDSVVQSVRLDLARLEQQEGQLRANYTDAHPTMVKLREQMDLLRQKMQVEARRVVRTAESAYRARAAQQASLTAELERTQAEIDEISMRLISFDNAKRELDAAKGVLTSLVGRQKETDVAQELKFSNVRVIDPAIVPRGPVRPNTRRDVLLALLVGLLAGVGLAFVLEYLDNTVKTPEDVRAHLRAPLLGIVPEVAGDADDRSKLATGQQQGSFLEGYRVVRTALHYCWTEKGPRVVVVTSTAPGEGKTLTSANLALTLAAQQRRVLLVDGDLRKPSAHALFDLARRPGLSDVLVGECPAEKAIRHVGDTGLDVLTAGTAAPSPGDLLTHEAMHAIVGSLRARYDWVIVDTPPVGAVADALVLASYADGVVVVVGAETVPRKGVARTLERVAETGSRLLGLVLNRARVQKHAYYYGHYYDHYYGSRDYGAEDREPKVVGLARARRLKGRA